jgi:hypothetical protein
MRLLAVSIVVGLLATLLTGQAVAVGDENLWSGLFTCGECSGCKGLGIRHYVIAEIDKGEFHLEDQTDKLYGDVDADGDISLWGSYRHPDASGKTRLTGHIAGDQLLARGKRGPRQCELKLTKMVRKQQIVTAAPDSGAVKPSGASPVQSEGKTTGEASTDAPKSQASTTTTQPKSTPTKLGAELPETAPPADQVATLGAMGLPPLEPIDAMYVAVQSAHVRSTPNVSATRVVTLNAGEKVTVLGKVAGQNWYYVARGDHPLGYVVANLLRPDAPTAEQSTAGAAKLGEPSLPVALTDVNFGVYHALVIGNNAYRAVPRLQTAIADARAVAQLLEREYGFEVTLLINASRAEVIDALAVLRERLVWNDNLLLYYAGHGVYDPDTDQGYWLPVDAEPKSPANWISNQDITGLLRAFKAKHVLVVADSCYSGTLTRGFMIGGTNDADYLRRMSKKKARTVLTSGGLEPVTDSGGGEHSVFAKAFLDALQANVGVLDGQELFARVREAVVLNALQTPEYNNVRLAGHDGGDFIFVRRP